MDEDNGGRGGDGDNPVSISVNESWQIVRLVSALFWLTFFILTLPNANIALFFICYEGRSC
jgi:hypothetical protein